jgi:hypothetical protein
MMDELKEQLNARLAELRAAKERFALEAQQQFNRQLAIYDGAIAEVERTLEMLAQEQENEGEKEGGTK